MAIKINGQMYYRTLEACQMAGVSRATFFRWLKAGILEDIMPRDRKGWRLFTEEDINRIKTEATRVTHRAALLEEVKHRSSRGGTGRNFYGQEDSGY